MLRLLGNPMNWTLIANTIRGLTMDAVQKANSGHPGMPMGTADFASVLFLKYLRQNPKNPNWLNRDRYVQSAGHGSMLLYSLLHLCGYDVTLDDLKSFRQWESKTPGHPEYGLTPGVETTTGPLGQGCGNAVGMALAEAMLAARFNREGYPIVDHRTFVIAGDGDMMEGVSHEAFSLAGHLGLHKLIVFYDYNRITIDGSTDLAYSDDVRKRFEGYHWNVLEIDGHDIAKIEQALDAAVAETQKPTLIIGHTHIGKGSPHKQDSSSAHGAPLGDEEVRLTKQALGLPPDEIFWIPDEVRAAFANRRCEWADMERRWLRLWAEYEAKFPELAREFKQFHEQLAPKDLETIGASIEVNKAAATRKVSGAVIQELAQRMPNLVGGSADLAESNNTLIKNGGRVQRGQFAGRNIFFGIREHAMGAILNGMALHGGFRVYGATFLVFSDYFKPAIRLAALMRLPVIYILTHDSILLGEDGPTHQPIEQLASLRSIPHLTIIRPADAAETVEAWKCAIRNTSGPTALILTRQSVPPVERVAPVSARQLEQGAYVLWQSGAGAPDLILIATGSEVAPAMDASKRLAEEGISVRVVSMPSWEMFEQQPASWRNAVLPELCEKRVAIEAASPFGWERYVGPMGVVIGMARFGASAPEHVLAEKFGFTASRICEVARSVLRKREERRG
jgi:transketolase